MNITIIEGIDKIQAAKLAKAGVTTIRHLLEFECPVTRKELSEDTGIAHTFIIVWYQHAQFFRIKGIRGQYAELLVRAGITSIYDLAQEEPHALNNKLRTANERTQKRIVRLLPGAKRCESWITQAKQLV